MLTVEVDDEVEADPARSRVRELEDQTELDRRLGTAVGVWETKGNKLSALGETKVGSAVLMTLLHAAYAYGVLPNVERGHAVVCQMDTRKRRTPSCLGSATQREALAKSPLAYPGFLLAASAFMRFIR